MANLNKAPTPFTYVGDGSTPHPLSRFYNEQAYRFVVPDSAGGTVAGGDIAVCDPVGGVFLVTYDNGTSREGALFMTTPTSVTKLVAVTDASFAGGTSATAGAISFYYDSTTGKFRLRNDVGTSQYTFDICRIL
ncbi:MAG: hypothetical protein D6698_10135 [Gammaproteobacteria bacterium]|nr:MAG: hypothetical protein D6698_10135 [Gammaproteobacteria bacterium]